MCPNCDNEMLTSLFDTVWPRPNKKERLVFKLPGSFCEKCSMLYIDPFILEKEGLTNLTCKFAIELDTLSYPEYYEWLEASSYDDMDEPPLDDEPS